MSIHRERILVEGLLE